MNRSIQFVLAFVLGFSGCSNSELLTPSEFTKDFAETIKKTNPNVKVEVLKDLELKVTTTDGRDSTSFLDNAYDTYKQDPSAKTEVIQRFVSASMETIENTSDAIDRTRIVPIIKDRVWLEETRRAILSRGAKIVSEQVYEDFSSDLIIVYAEDSPKNIRYLSEEDLKRAKVERSELRALACENLERLLPKIERHGQDGLFMFTAGGTFEASLVLFDSIWNSGQIEVNGDLVVAIPTRDLLLVTGSKDEQGIAKVKQMIENAFSNGSYQLSRKLLVYRNGRFAEFEESSEPHSQANDSQPTGTETK